MIYVDCDGTLIDYDDAPRADVVAAVKEFLTGGHEVTVWSGGGAAYASMLKYRLGLDAAASMGKDWRVLKDGDIVVDDMDFEKPPSKPGVFVMLPEEFAARFSGA